MNGPGRSNLADLLSGFELEGYRGQMAARPGARILCMACHQESDAEEMEVDGLQRVEGASDPADMLIVAALVCPICGTQGTLVLTYGPEADPDDSEVLSLLGDVDG